MNLYDQIPKISKTNRLGYIVYKGEPMSSATGHSGNSFYKKGDYQKYIDTLSVLIKERIGGEWNTALYSFGLRVVFHLGNRRKVDVDNLLKPVMDAGTGIVWADDSQVVEFYSKINRDVDIPGLEILIYTVGRWVDYHGNCLVCGKELSGKGLTRKFCSHECYVKERQKYIKQIICKFCGKMFWSGRYEKNRKLGKVFCSRDCYTKWVKENGAIWAKNFTVKKAWQEILE